MPLKLNSTGMRRIYANDRKLLVRIWYFMSDRNCKELNLDQKKPLDFNPEASDTKEKNFSLETHRLKTYYKNYF